MTARALRRRGRLWTLTSVAHAVPFTLAAILLVLFLPLVLLPVALILLAHAWIIPELYAARGANVVRPRRRRGRAGSGACRARGGGADPAAEERSLGLLGDLLDGDARALQRGTGLALQRGRLGTWLLGEAGALLVAPRGRRVFCFCVHASDAELPAGDRIAHLLLALRSDEAGFATVANLAFSGAPWRLRRRLGEDERTALSAAVTSARR